MKVEATIVEVSLRSTSTQPVEYRIILTATGSKKECEKLAKKIFK